MFHVRFLLANDDVRETRCSSTFGLGMVVNRSYWQQLDAQVALVHHPQVPSRAHETSKHIKFIKHRCRQTVSYRGGTMARTIFITLPAGAVAKYCNEHVSVCVCLSVCLSANVYPKIIFNACCQWPWLGPSPAGWQNPKGKGNFGVFLPHWQCIIQHSIWDPYKNGWTDRDAIWVDNSGGPEVC